MKNYNFRWSDLGDIKQGRPNLGDEVPLLIYRMMQFTLRDILSKELGTEATEELFAKAGELTGSEFCRNVLNKNQPLPEFISDLGKKLIDLKMGILRVESADMENLTFTVTISEDLDCSGLPVLGATVCDYDEGFLAGIFHEYTGKNFTVKEIDCWATGDRTCRFEIRPNGN